MKKRLVLFIIVLLLISCASEKEDVKYIRIFENYYTALQAKDGSHWNFTSDTVRLWFDDKNSNPIVSIKNSNTVGPWKHWDEEMHSRSHYDSIWYDKEERVIKGYFYENNDFYRLIGKKPTKTLRTFWFDKNDKISEILIYWIPEENTTSDKHLKPIVKWAMQYDSSEIKVLYPEGKIIPSAENARRWKALLARYQQHLDSLNHAR